MKVETKTLMLSNVYKCHEQTFNTYKLVTVNFLNGENIGQFSISNETNKILSMVGYCANLDEVVKVYTTPTGREK